MKLCKMHKHSSVEKAVRCYAKRKGRNADKALEDQFGKDLVYIRKQVKMVKNSPPRTTKHGEVELVVFFEDSNMRY